MPHSLHSADHLKVPRYVTYIKETLKYKKLILALYIQSNPAFLNSQRTGQIIRYNAILEMIQL